MDYIEAKEILSFHGGGNQNLNNDVELSQKYLCPSLYHFKGKLIDGNEYNNIKIASYAVYCHFKGKSFVDKEAIKYIYWIIENIELQALRDKSYLRRNKLISDSQLITLKKWKYECSSILVNLLSDFDSITLENISN